MKKPTQKPQNPNFSCGPCSKRPGWSTDHLKNALLGRSHRSGDAKKLLKHVIEKQKQLLGIPENYRIGIVPASDTGAIEMAMWSMLGERPVDVVTYDHFAREWQTDVQNHLKLDMTLHDADYGELPDLNAINCDNDVVFLWNGTTAGVRVPNGDWILSDRKGLTFCDATSAIFACEMPWDKLDVTTWSWQKALGSEAAHGMLVLSPRAVERLESYDPGRPLPKILRLTKNGKLIEGIFEGLTLNTPSLMAVEDCLDSLNWIESIGGVQRTIERATGNLNVIKDWVDTKDHFELLAKDMSFASNTSVCIKITDPWFEEKSTEDQAAIIKEICGLLEAEKAGYDVKHYAKAPPGFRLWCGATVEASDIAAVLPWIEWGYEEVKQRG